MCNRLNDTLLTLLLEKVCSNSYKNTFTSSFDEAQFDSGHGTGT